MKKKVAILKGEIPGLEDEWIISCEKRRDIVEYIIIDIAAHDWLEQSLSANFDVYLARPAGRRELHKKIYDERLYILNRILGKTIYPSLDELLIYENKRFLSYWLKANHIPHPETYVFYSREKAAQFVNTAKFPVVSKSNIGAGGKGVIIHKNKKSLLNYNEMVFRGKGATLSWSPNLRKGQLIRRLIKRLSKPFETFSYIRSRKKTAEAEPQKDFILLQEFIQCDHEWRCVKIGNSYFGHKKLRTWGEKISGTSAVSWDVPPERLLNFLKDICEKGNFSSMAIDVFEDYNGNYFVNELQCFFGSKNPHQMINNGKPGRFIIENGKWVFEEGNFNTNNSFDLRLNYILKYILNL